MTELDPYAVLGVARAASREEIARAYRRLAKQHHPDRGAAPSRTMARVNEAWHTLSDPTRRARWDRTHTVVEPAHWAAQTAPVEVARRPPPVAAVSPTRRDSGWLAVGVVTAAAVMVALVMVGISLAASSPSVQDSGARIARDGLSFTLPASWVVAQGASGQPVEHRIVAHAVTFALEPAELCTTFGETCNLGVDSVPPGNASIVVTAWEGGPPPVADPVRRRPYGLHADRIIGGEPAAFRWEPGGDGALAWWQLSPPGFPDRWFEVHATIGGGVREQHTMLARIEGMLATVRFER